MRVITLAGSPRYPSRSSALLEYARETLSAADIEVCHWHLQNFAPEDLLYARFDNPALHALNEQLAGADGLIIATPVYKASFQAHSRRCLICCRNARWKAKSFCRWLPAGPSRICWRWITP